MSHRTALCLSIAAVAALFASFVLRGRVVLAGPIHDEILEQVRGEETERAKSFRDQPTFFLPELHHQLQGERSGWLASWNPHVELGRPARHLGGLSRAWIVTNAVSFVTRDAFAAYTLLSLLAVLGCAVFGHLLLRSMGLAPAACLLGAVALSLGVYVSYWLTFALYVWGVCWTLALLWLVPLYLERPSAARGLGIAFALYSLILSSYPQQTVWHAWLMLLVFGRALFASERPRAARLRAVLGLAGWAGLAAACAGPVWVDALLDLAQSGRTEVDTSFFFETLPTIGSARDLSAFAARVYDASWFGNPIGRDYPFKIRGVSWTPVLSALLAVSFCSSGGRSARAWWPWQLFLLATLAVSLFPALYRTGIQWFGLGLSRHAPLAGAHVPLGVLAALAADRLLREDRPGRVVATLAALGPLALALPGAFLGGESVASGFFGASLLFAAGAALFAWNRSPVLLAVPASHYAFQLRLSVPRSEALRDSGLSARMRAETADGSRFLWVGRQYRYLLRPNQEALFGLRSPNAYDPVTSRRWQSLIDSISSEGAQIYGRQFLRVEDAARLDAERLAAAGIGLLLSVEALPPELARRFHVTARLGFWRPRRAPVLEAQLLEFDARAPEASTDGVLATPSLPVRRTLDRGDQLDFEVSPSESETLLFVSQQYDARWRAWADGAPAETLEVDGFYQGVRLPPGTADVRLGFRPSTRWAFVPQVFFLVAFAYAAAVRRRRRP